MSPYTRPGRRPPPRWALALMIAPFALIDTFAAIAVALGLIDLVIHGIMWLARRSG